MTWSLARSAGERQGWLQWLVLAAATTASVIPFSGKAFHIDDTLFLQAARQILSHPWDPYGSSVNWYGTMTPMSEIMKNPPLNCYFLALAARLAGWSETALHIAFLVPALAVILGTYRLARFLCKQPLVAALLTLVSPAFLVSSTTVMCDVPMLAFWIWAVVLWMKGLEEDDPARLILASVLVALSALTKYFGISLIPLLLIYTAIKKRKVGWWLVFLLIPSAVLGLYQYETLRLYGRGMLLDAAEYATGTRQDLGATFLPKTLVGLSFLGGCFLTVLASPFSVRAKRWIWLGAISIGVLILTLASMETLGGFPLVDEAGKTKWLLILQISVFVTAGLAVMILAAADLTIRRDADSVLIVSWILGTLLFAAYLNWTVNVRSILPLVPAAGILLVRRVEDAQPRQAPQSTAMRKKRTPPPQRRTSPLNRARWIYTLIPAGCVAILVTYADGVFADSARTAATEIRQQYSRDRLFFEGHWGFQYYMESLDSRAVDLLNTGEMRPGDVLVIPVHNTSTRPVPENAAAALPDVVVGPSRWLATMAPEVGAGFYHAGWGPLPYAFGAVPPERYLIYRINPQS